MSTDKKTERRPEWTAQARLGMYLRRTSAIQLHRGNRASNRGKHV